MRKVRRFRVTLRLTVPFLSPVNVRRYSPGGRSSLLFGQMPLKISAILKDAENIDYALAFAGAIDDEVPGVLHNSKSGARPVAAEA
jgi:hypothetical protein